MDVASAADRISILSVGLVRMSVSAGFGTLDIQVGDHRMRLTESRIELRIGERAPVVLDMHKPS